MLKRLVKIKEVYRYNIKHNSVAVVSDGSRWIGKQRASCIARHGRKAILFKEFANIDAFLLCAYTRPDEIVSLVRNIAPVFGGNLEDLSTPKCFTLRALQDLSSCHA